MKEVLFEGRCFYLHAAFCLLKRERCELKRKEPRNGEKQKGLQEKAFDEERESYREKPKAFVERYVSETELVRGWLPFLEWQV